MVQGTSARRLTRREVLEWFESLHSKPPSANWSLPVLAVILRQAEVYGYRPEDSNPCKDIKRYRRRARKRFLSPDEIRRVVGVLNRYGTHSPARRRCGAFPLRRWPVCSVMPMSA